MGWNQVVGKSSLGGSEIYSKYAVREKKQGGSKKLYNGKLVSRIELDFGRTGG